MAGNIRLRHGNILHDILISKWYTMRAVAFIHWMLLAIVKMGLRASWYCRTQKFHKIAILFPHIFAHMHIEKLLLKSERWFPGCLLNWLGAKTPRVYIWKAALLSPRCMGIHEKKLSIAHVFCSPCEIVCARWIHGCEGQVNNIS